MGRVRRLAMQTEPAITVEDAAAELGISLYQYRTARNIVYLMDEELTEDEWGAVTEATRHIAGGEVKMAYNLMNPIWHRHFGDSSSTQGGPPAARERAVTQFTASVTTLTDTMLMAGDLVVPYLDNNERDRIGEMVDEALVAVNTMRHILADGGTHNVVST